MKKVVRCICMMAVVALAFTSCNKEEKLVSVIRCSTEQFIEMAEEDAKADFNGTQFVFETGDPVMLYNVDNETPTNSVCGLYTSQGSGTSVLFESTSPLAPGKKSAFYAFYPGTFVEEQLASGNRCTFKLDENQTYRASSTGKPMVPQNVLYMAAKDATTANLTDVTFQFKNICGIISLKLYNANGKTIKKIRVTDKRFHLAGNVQLILPELDPDEMTSMFNNYNESNATYMAQLATYKDRIGYNVTNAKMSITLDLGDGVALGKTKNTATEFYMVLRPLALSQGCIIEVSEDGTTWQTIANSNKNNCIRPNYITKFNAIKVD